MVFVAGVTAKKAAVLSVMVALLAATGQIWVDQKV